MQSEEIVTRFVEGRHELRTLPGILAEVIRITSSSDPDMNDLERLLSRDPVIAGTVMRRANSAFYGRRADNLKQAFAHIGWEAAIHIALSTSVVHTFFKWPTQVDFNRLWRHSLDVAVISRLLARKLKVRCPEVNYTIGLMHDLGILVLDEMNPGSYGWMLNLFMADEDLAELERQFFQTDHCEVASGLFRRWGLPASLWTPVKDHHSLGRKDDVGPASRLT